MSNKMKQNIKSWTKAVLIAASVGGVLFAASAMAAAGGTGGGATSLTQIESNLQSSVSVVAKILVMLSTIAGIGFIMASFFKFHQHKMNPQQVPMSQGITLVIIGAAMVVFPYLLEPTAQAVFGNSVASITGSAISSIIGS